MNASSERFIFVAGHCRGGSTVLGAILNWHPAICSGFTGLGGIASVSEFINRVYEPKFHTKYRLTVEQGEIWNKYLPLNERYAADNSHQYRQKNIKLSTKALSSMLTELTINCPTKRFLCKRPPLALQLGTMKLNFTGSKIIALCRYGEEVVASHLLHGPPALKALPKKKQLIRSVNRWKSYLNEIEKNKAGIKIINYDSLRCNPGPTLEEILEFIKLPIKDYIYEVKLKNTKDKWKKTIPEEYHEYLKKATKEGNLLIKQLEKET